jgi:hypothetical protein
MPPGIEIGVAVFPLAKSSKTCWPEISNAQKRSSVVGQFEILPLLTSRRDPCHAWGMQKRTSTKLDSVQNARRVVLESTQETSLTVISNPSLLSQIMREMGRKGGKIGGKRRLKTMTAEERHNVASNAAKTRWAKAKAKPKKRP